MDEIRPSGTLEDHRAQLFAAYTDAMFHRRAPTTPYTREQTEHWLTWVAKAMKDHSQTILYLEWMQPDWLSVQRQQRLVTFITAGMSGLICGLIGGLNEGVSRGLRHGLIGGLGFGLIGSLSVGIRSWLVGYLIGGLIGGLIEGLSFGLSLGLSRGLRHGLIGGLSLGLIGGLSVMLVGHSKEIKPIEQIRWSWSAARYKWMSHLFKRLSGGLIFGLSFGLISGLSGGLIFGLSFGLIVGLSGGLIFGLKDGFTISEIRTQSFPNEGIRRSGRNALISWLSFGLLSVLSFGLLSVLSFGLINRGLGGLLASILDGLSVWLSFGLSFGLIFGLRFGGRACLHHCALRLILWHNNFAPLRYVRFLDYATARIFLRKVGGGYVFVHRMLLEHFAAKDQTSAEQQHCNTHG